MDKDELFKQYQRYISDLVSLSSSEDNLQNNIAQEERNIVAELEKEYSQITAELQNIKRIVTSQYRSVWESCTANAGLKRPEAQRPSYTDLTWRECVKIQEKAAKETQEWFAVKTQQIIAERKRQLQEDAARKAASAISANEAARKKEEETAALEEIQGASFLEELKRKFRKNS